MSVHPNYDRVVAALLEHSEEVAQTVARLIIALGAKAEWSMEDNFCTTEEIAALASSCGLPRAGDQGDEELTYYGLAAQSLGYDADIDNWDLDLESSESRQYYIETGCYLRHEE